MYGQTDRPAMIATTADEQTLELLKVQLSLGDEVKEEGGKKTYVPCEVNAALTCRAGWLAGYLLYACIACSM